MRRSILSNSSTPSVPNNGKFSSPSPYSLAEEQTEGVLGIVRAAAEAAANTQAGVDLKSGRAVGIDQLDARRSLPGIAVAAGFT